MSVENWKKIWNNREDIIDTLDLNDTEKVYMELKRADGFDITENPIPYNSWYNQYKEIKNKLNVTPPPEGVFEVGCGSAPNLFLFDKDGIKVGGMDYSEKLISIAKKVFAKKPLEELILGEAINLPTDIKYDAVISCGVFHYFPDIKYAEVVLEKMIQKATKIVGILNIHDVAKEAAFLECRRKITPNYDELYADLPKLFFDKQFFVDFAKKHNLDIEITLLPLEGFWDNDFIFDVFMYKRC